MVDAYRNRLQKVGTKIGLDGFIITLLGMILLAYIWPTPGIKQGIFSLKEIANYGVSLIFFFYGLRLSPEKIREGLGNWRLHLVVQITTFILFPLLILLLGTIIPVTGREMLWLGVFFVAALPSTVSSSVVMVSLAKGNIPGAIFNASISALLGVFITPIWMGVFINTSNGDLDLSVIIFKLILQVIVPVALGILLHPKLGAFADRHKKTLRKSDQLTILLIVYTAFCQSFAEKMFNGFTIFELFFLGIGMACLFFLMAGTLTVISRLLRFSREDSITALFCGSKKSLVHGTVMSKVLFPHSAAAGIILLPLMFYHAIQLIAASIIAKRMGEKG
ncbi:bile acid:sodium symporter family protein [Williamwhitmania taraxaci]|uniref:Solute carrier family 10 (Sodium/bile acid cotransporter), member 7 n=1 Tax=Williamwhitmania taraxaci TaxID=1640674 RepID=A0A1G6GMA8_9BACT|nr:bile acid:sodium symporter family protein [Williamwhitmania taraxaci]SDB83151.1 solute carrier family 10 (sodium/bile acid cotransporter), member 7 [Williamwhitmania taraxaci]